MGKFVVIELQTTMDGQVLHIVDAFDNQDAAESKYHTILAAAAISTLPCHAACILSGEGFPVAHACYKHEA